MAASYVINHRAQSAPGLGIDAGDYRFAPFSDRRSMTEPKFKIGESVYLRLRVSRSKEPSGISYLVIQQLPTSRGEIRYRLRSTDNQERIASERELRPVSKFS